MLKARFGTVIKTLGPVNNANTVFVSVQAANADHNIVASLWSDL
jgi:hypothetical protein